MRDHPPPPSYTTILHQSYIILSPWPSWQHTIGSNSHIRPAPAFSASIWTCQYSRFQIICTLHKSAAKRLVLVHVQVLALSQAFERQLDQLSNITGYLRLSSLTGQIHPAVKKITKAGVQLSTIWRKEASSQSERTFPLAKCSGATAGDRFGRPTKSPNWPDYRPIESPTA